MGEPKLMRFAQIRPLGSVLGTSFRSPPSQSSENFRGHEKAGEDRGDNWYLSRLEFFHNTFMLNYLPKYSKKSLTSQIICKNFSSYKNAKKCLDHSMI